MGARLHYAKVIDRQLFLDRGGKVHPGLVNEVIMDEESGLTAAFLILRAWGDDHGAFTEQWRLESPGGLVVYEGVPRELHMATESHVERLEDEIVDLKLEFPADDYETVFLLDDQEVARVRFAVTLGNGARPT